MKSLPSKSGPALKTRDGDLNSSSVGCREPPAANSPPTRAVDALNFIALKLGNCRECRGGSYALCVVPRIQREARQVYGDTTDYESHLHKWSVSPRVCVCGSAAAGPTCSVWNLDFKSRLRKKATCTHKKRKRSETAEERQEWIVARRVRVDRTAC